MPGYTTVGLFAEYYISPKATISINASNLLDTEGFTEGEEDAITDNGGDQYVRLRSIAGRTVNASLRYRF